MTATAPTGARSRRGRPRQHESPRARAYARREPPPAARPSVTAASHTTQLTSVVEVDLTGVAAGAVLATVAASAVRSAVAHPGVAGGHRVHLGVLAAEDGTLAVVVEDAQELTDPALADRIAAHQRAGVDVTLSVVDTGSRGVLLDTPSVGADRTPVLGIGAVVRRPVVLQTDGGEAIVVRAMVHLSLSHDPRLLGSAEAARFLHAVHLDLEERTA